MSKPSPEEVQSLRNRICYGERELISTLTPDQFFPLLSHDTVLEIIDTKQAHIEKCRKRLEQEATP